METVLSELAARMSEFKKNSAAVLREARNRPVAVLNHNRPAFYMGEPALFKAMMDELADQDLHRKAVAYLAEKSRAVEVGIDQL
jgi:antitoxin StbD